METELSIHFFVTGACLNILTVKSAMSGDRVQHSFLCDRSLCKHLDSEECYEWKQSSALISL